MPCMQYGMSQSSDTGPSPQCCAILCEECHHVLNRPASLMIWSSQHAACMTSRLARDVRAALQNGRIWAMQLPFWRDKFCPAHAQDGTPKCGGCARMQPANAQWVQIQKGRHLCLDCLESVVVDTHDAQPLYNKVEFVAGMVHQAAAAIHFIACEPMRWHESKLLQLAPQMI